MYFKNLIYLIFTFYSLGLLAQPETTSYTHQLMVESYREPSSEPEELYREVIRDYDIYDFIIQIFYTDPQGNKIKVDDYYYFIKETKELRVKGHMVKVHQIKNFRDFNSYLVEFKDERLGVFEFWNRSVSIHFFNNNELDEYMEETGHKYPYLHKSYGYINDKFIN